MQTTPFISRYKAAKRWFASSFILLYLIPLSVLLFHTMTRSNAGGNAVLLLLFGVPLYSVWAAVLDYSWFQKGVAPFSPGVKSKIILFGLAQGIASTLLCFIAGPILNAFKGFQTFTGVLFMIFGYAALPAVIFATGVLIKAAKAARHTDSNLQFDTDASRRSR
jgi:hypothetical protein